MSYFLLIAGVPAAIYDDVLSIGSKRLASGKGKVIGSPLAPGPSGQYRYKESYANGILSKLVSASPSEQGKSYLMLIYVDYPDESTSGLLNRFMAFVLPCGLRPSS